MIDDTYRSVIRMPEPVHKQLARAAKITGRSLNAEMVARLEASLRGETFADEATKDPLAAAYMAANSIEEYANAIRAAVLMKKMRDGDIEVNDETYPGLAALAPDAVRMPAPMNPEDALSQEERQLAEAYKKLKPSARKALLMLISGE